MLYPEDLIKSLLNEANIVQVVSSYIPVIKKGRNYVALCPFHDDKNPSLSISEDKQIFKCFVCGTGGNAITFTQKYEHISYDEAVRKIADMVGFKDDRLNKSAYRPAVDKEKTPLYACINDLESLYQYGLSIPESEKAREYLANRHIDDSLIKKYKIGYALSDGKKTIEYLEKKKHSIVSIRGIGILSSSGGDSNAGRVIFPLANPSGQIVGFSARKIDKDSDSPKYINSPETKIFKKGHILYNYHNAKESARSDGYCYLLEGFMDVMALDKAGIRSAVALMGTALTEEQISLLRKLNCEIRLCLDGDNPGQAGMMKIINQLTKDKIPFRLVLNPKDLRDPDDILQESGPETLFRMMNNLVDPFEFQINYYTNVLQLTSSEDKKKVLYHFLPYLQSLPSGIEQENCLYRLSKVTGYEPETIRNLLARSKKDTIEGYSKGDYKDLIDKDKLHPERRYTMRLEKAEREALYYMMQRKEAVDYFVNNIDNFFNAVYNRIAEYLVETVSKTGETLEPKDLISKISASDEDPDPLISEVSSLSEEDIHPPYSLQAMEACQEAISEEKTKLFEGKKIQEALKGTDDENKKGEMLKAYGEQLLQRKTNKK